MHVLTLFFCNYRFLPDICVLYRVASAPGKVLMTGGYLVLERPNAGLVLSTNARFYASVKPIYDDVKPEAWSWVCTMCNLF